jgi:hypothetical protein
MRRSGGPVDISDHSIYLYKPPETENYVNSWVYYRIDSVRGPDEPEGSMYAPIQMCKVSWPLFKDIKPVIDTPGITGLASAWDQMCSVAKNQWGVDHKQSILIGCLEYDTKTGRPLTETLTDQSKNTRMEPNEPSRK